MSDVTAEQWWSSRRFQYNRGLFIAGILAFIAYVAVGSIFLRNDPDFEVTIFTTLFQGLGFLVMMVIANIFYSLGYASERIIRPNNPDRYRKVCYRMGFGLSVLLPFAVPVLLAISSVVP